MEYLVGLLIAALGGVFYFKNKADNKAVEVKLAESKGKDEVLAQEQFDLEAAIQEIDNNIAKVKKEKEDAKKKNDNLSLAEIRDQIRKGLKR